MEVADFLELNAHEEGLLSGDQNLGVGGNVEDRLDSRAVEQKHIVKSFFELGVSTHLLHFHLEFFEDLLDSKLVKNNLVPNKPVRTHGLVDHGLALLEK